MKLIRNLFTYYLLLCFIHWVGTVVANNERINYDLSLGRITDCTLDNSGLLYHTECLTRTKAN